MFLRSDDMLEVSCAAALLQVMIWSGFTAPSRTTADRGEHRSSCKVNVVGNLALNQNTRLWRASC